MIENLEQRQLLAAWVQEGTLVIRGSDLPERISLELVKKELILHAPGQGTAFSLSNNIKRIQIWGGGGNDVLDLRKSLKVPHLIVGGDGNDLVHGSRHADQIEGGAGNDTLLGNQGNDTLFGGTGRDVLAGGEAKDALDGEGGPDTLRGDGGGDVAVQVKGKAPDLFADRAAGDKVVGGGLQVPLRPSGPPQSPTPIVVNPIVVKPIEIPVFTPPVFRPPVFTPPVVRPAFVHWDNGVTISVEEGVLTIRANNFLTIPDANAPWLTPGRVLHVDNASRQLLVRGEKPHHRQTFPKAAVTRVVIHGSAGGDSIDATGLSVPVEVHGGEGRDVLYGGSGDDLLHGDAGNDVLDGGFGDDTIYGGAGGDVQAGGEGDDRLYALDGEWDTLSGGAGDDWADNAGDEGHDLEQRVDVPVTGGSGSIEVPHQAGGTISTVSTGSLSLNGSTGSISSFNGITLTGSSYSFAFANLKPSPVVLSSDSGIPTLSLGPAGD